MGVLIPGTHTEAKPSNEIVIGIFPRRNPELTIKLFTPLARHLEKELGKPVKLITTKDFESFWAGVESQRYDIVHYNQYHYVKSKKLHGYEVILKNEEFGEDTIAGSLVARTDSAINSIDDLKGKKIVFGGSRSAMQSYIVATYLLRQAGLQAGDYKEAFSRNPPNAIFASYYGQAAASGTGDKVLKLPVVTKKIDASKMKFLTRGEQLPHLPWAIKNTVPIEEQQKIQSLLSGLKNFRKGKEILAHAKLTGLNIAEDSDYDAHRGMILTVLNEDYCDTGCSKNKLRTDDSNRPLFLGIFPRRSQSKTKRMFRPLARYLEKKLGRKVILEVPRDFQAFWSKVVEKHYDIVHLNQYQYLKSHKLYDYQVVLKNEEKGSASIGPALIVRKDSSYTKVADLKDKHIMFGGNKTAMISYIAAMKLLKKGGLKEKDFVGSFAINPANTCRLVVNKQADACAVAAHYLEMAKKSQDVSQLKVLIKGKPMPHFPWAVKGATNSQLVREIKNALLSLNNTKEGKKILEGAVLTSIKPASDREYNVYRRMIREILNERF